VTYQTIQYDKRDGIAVVTLNRPDRHNAIDSVMARELPRVWHDIIADRSVAVAVVTGAGRRAFCTGFDMGDLASGVADVGDALRFTSLQNRCCKPVVTAINGMVCGGGLHFVADTDLLVCSETATFFDTHVNVGLVAGLEPIGLARRIALDPVLRLSLLGRAERMSAARAYEIGLAGEVVAPDALLPRALELAAQIAQSSPSAVARTKRAIWESLDVGLAEALELGWRTIEEHKGDPDVVEGAAAFRERRAPRWSRDHV